MASKSLNFYTLFHLLPFLLVISVLVIILPHVRGISPETTYKRDALAPATSGTVKTVEGENGDVVDCVDIYKQPAFNHPLLKDHKLQMNPSSSFSKLYENNSAPNFLQPWHKNGICSEGTVPIRRRQLVGSQANSSMQGPHHEYAGILSYPPTGQRYYGGGGLISIWKPFVARTRDFSASTLIVSLSSQAFLVTGWMVNAAQYGDFESRFFVYWTRDNSVSTGCYDLHCEGFVHVNKEVALGVPLVHVSKVGGFIFSFRIIIALDRPNGNWWLYVGGKPIGYWPAALFSGIPEGAERLKWGGQIYDSIGSSRHTSTDMGNGQFPETNQASRVCSLTYVDGAFTLRRPLQSSLRSLVTNPLCYNAQLLPTDDPTNGLCFVFGGSGLSAKCP